MSYSISIRKPTIAEAKQELAQQMQSLLSQQQAHNLDLPGLKAYVDYCLNRTHDIEGKDVVIVATGSIVTIMTDSGPRIEHSQASVSISQEEPAVQGVLSE